MQLKQILLRATALITTAFIAVTMFTTSQVLMSYNMETDGGATDHVLTQARWDAAVNSGARILYFPGTNWTSTAKNLQLQDNISMEGDGQNVTTMRLSTSVSTTSSDNWFQSIGHSYITVKDIRFVSGATHQMNAVFKFNSMGVSSTTECRGIGFYGVTFDTTWADCFKGGEKAPGETHHIYDLTVKNCNFLNVGNPSAPYNFDDNAGNSVRFNAINGSQTLWTANITDNYGYNISGDFFKTNITGLQGSDGFIANPEIGNFIAKGNRIINFYIAFENLGNLINKPIYTGNTMINCTRNGGLPLSVTANAAILKDNIIENWEGRDGEEVRCANSDIANKIIIHRSASPYPNTARTVKNSACNGTLTTGYKNHIHSIISYDWSGTKATNCPDRLCGVHIAGWDDPSSKPLSYEGKSYMFGFNFDGLEVYQTTGPAVYAEIIPVARVFVKNATFESSHQNETVIKAYNTTGDLGWVTDKSDFNLIGSAAAPNGAALMGVHTPLQGNVQSNSFLLNYRKYTPSKWSNAAAAIGNKTGNQVDFTQSFGSSN